VTSPTTSPNKYSPTKRSLDVDRGGLSPSTTTATPSPSPNRLSPNKISFELLRRTKPSPDSPYRSVNVSPRSPKSPLTNMLVPWSASPSPSSSPAARVTTRPELKPVPSGLTDIEAYTLGRYHLKGGKDRKAQNPGEAFRYLMHASGMAKAQVLLGVMYENGAVPGHPVDIREAFNWYQQAADMGNHKAQCQIGALLDPQDPGKAFQYFLTSAQQGDKYAQYNVACNYADGRHVEQDLEQAANWYQKSAEQGFKDAQFQYALCLESGLGVNKNPGKAFEWLLKAAEQGLPEAQHGVAEMYHDNDVLHQNLTLAHEWYLKAAEQGFAPAQHNLGYLYDSGEGVKMNLSTAADWYYKAADQGYEKAKLAHAELMAMPYAESDDEGQDPVAPSSNPAVIITSASSGPRPNLSSNRSDQPAGPNS
jgi:TPR repeat protein